MLEPIAVRGQRPAGGEDEAALLAALRAGEEGAYRELLTLYGGRLLAVARRILRNEEEARDALQEAFLQAFRALPRFEGQSRISTWLHRIVVNAALMKIRSKKARPEEPIEPLLPTFQVDGHSTVDFREWEDGAERQLERTETRQLVRAAIERLPDTYRNILILRDIEELDTAEVAELLGITANAVKIRLHRARQALRGLLDPHFRVDFA
ncbi:MAG: sigma-70 family RNA polymerase sigma factor [Candidatus Binatia bacterium]